MIEIYTDGACSGNPGRGGLGVVFRFQGHQKLLAQGYLRTTNNRMELRAVIHALENLKSNKYKVRIFTDSRYVCDTINKGWLDNWIKSNYKGKKNSDLWKKYVELSSKFDLEFVWVKGHDSIEGNQLADQLAVNARLQENLKEDEGFI